MKPLSGRLRQWLLHTRSDVLPAERHAVRGAGRQPSPGHRRGLI